jgi:hypothetical protein
MKKNQYQELIEFIAGQFQIVHDDIIFLKIKADKTDIKIDNIQTSVDNLTKMVKDLQDDSVIINHRLEVLEEKVLR